MENTLSLSPQDVQTIIPALEKELEEKRGECTQLEELIRKLQLQAAGSAKSDAGSEILRPSIRLTTIYPSGFVRKGRRPRGENLALIKQHLKLHGATGTNAVAAALDLQPSSASNVLRSNPEIFMSTDEGWILKETSETSRD